MLLMTTNNRVPPIKISIFLIYQIPVIFSSIVYSRESPLSKSLYVYLICKRFYPLLPVIIFSILYSTVNRALYQSPYNSHLQKLPPSSPIYFLLHILFFVRASVRSPLWVFFPSFLMAFKLLLIKNFGNSFSCFVTFSLFPSFYPHIIPFSSLPSLSLFSPPLLFSRANIMKACIINF
uniref:Uncharacterized protein n=1 Tax=Cacopsylla melanoneura TaxID=428564 RepID=A0A8D8YV56_9HEMI